MSLRSRTPAELREAVARLREPAFRAEQIFRWMHGPGTEGMGAVRDSSHGRAGSAANIPSRLREQLLAEHPLTPLTLELTQQAGDGTRKFRFRTVDGQAIESVLIPDDRGDRDKLTLCVSSQVGCALGCGFCATATLGLDRNLEAAEIVEQVYWASDVAGRRPTNIVFMGMGEPLHNFENVRRAFELLLHPWGAGFSPRRITVSTVGLVTGIAKLAQLSPTPNLAVSLNATTDEVRSRLMPVNRRWPIAELMAAVRAFPLAHGRKVTFEYVLLADVNDSDDDAHRLVKLVRGLPCMINVIPWNPFAGPLFRRPGTDRIFAFQDIVRRADVPVYIRMPRGDDIDAACGQLAAREPGSSPPVTVDANLVRRLRTARTDWAA